jgi:hypothetical protein
MFEKIFIKIVKSSVSPWMGGTGTIFFLIAGIILYTFKVEDFYPTAFIGLLGFFLLWMMQIYVCIKCPGIKDVMDD